MNKKGNNIFDKNLLVKRPEINLNTFCFLFSEIIQFYLQKYKDETSKVDQELEKLGEQIGPRILELIIFREQQQKHENKHLEMLRFLHNQVWKTLFGKAADSLEKTKDSEGEYMIKTYNLPIIKYLSDSNRNFSACTFMVGILKGILLSAGFESKVQQVNQETPDKGSLTIFIIEFDKSVLLREI